MIYIQKTNFGVRILTVQNLRTNIRFISNLVDFVHILTVYGEIINCKHNIQRAQSLNF